jgi:homoserine kinase
MKSIKLKIPATSANLGPGFDVLGVALSFYNEIYLEVDGLSSTIRSKPRLEVLLEGEGSDTLARDASNLTVKSALAYFASVGKRPLRMKLWMNNRIPLSRGMGSSAAASLGGYLAAALLSGEADGNERALAMAIDTEGHPDNVVPALRGGFCISGIGDREIRHLRFDMPEELQAVVCVPERPLPTAKARAVVPKTFSRADTVFTANRVAFLIGALVQKKFDWLGFAMQDVVHQPYRAKLLPGLMPVIESARKAGAYGAALSGAGSCMLAIAPKGRGEAIGEAMCRRFETYRVKSDWMVLEFDNRGATIL